MSKASEACKRIDKELKDLTGKIDTQLSALSTAYEGIPVHHLSLDWCHKDIDADLVDEVFDDLRKRFGSGNEQLLVVVSSGGGDIDAAYNLAMLFRRYGERRLWYLVPRWAKSAATLLVCGGDKILMTPVAELGPLDPQITASNPLERRIENFSPLHIKSTLDLIDEQYKAGKEELANALVQRLQYPLTLGSYKKSLDIGKSYLADLLGSRMLVGRPDDVKSVSVKLTEGYVDHGATILCREVQKLQLVAEELTDGPLDAAWQIHRHEVRKHKLAHEREKVNMQERLKDLPPGLLDAVKSDGKDRKGEPRS